MAEQSISYGIGLSDQQLNAMLNSDVPEIRSQAENYIATAQSQQAEKPNILQRIGNFFNIGSAGAAEPDLNVITGQPVNTTNQFPFKSMADMAAENELALNQMFATPKDTLTSLQNFQENYYLPNQNTGITETNAARQFEKPFEVIGGQKVYLGDKIGKAQALEKANFFQEPTGILSQAKDFITQKLPKTFKSGVETLIDFIPGMRFIRGLDKFDSLPYLDRQFIKSRMTGNVPGFYVDPRSGALKDFRGKNVRSLLGNYAESIEKDYANKVESIEKSKNRWKNKFGSLDNTNQYGKTWEEMNKYNLNEFNFLKTQKDIKDKQTRTFLDKVKKQVDSGQTSDFGQSFHGGDNKQTGGGKQRFDGARTRAQYDKDPTAYSGSF